MDNHTENDFIKHIECSNCGSSDANSLYSDGHQYCFSCETYVHGDNDKQQTTSLPKQADNGESFISGQYQDLVKRKISSETCKKLGYKIGEYNGQKCHVVDLFDAKGKRVAQKIRLPGKEFRVIGDLNKAGLIFQNKFKSGGKRLVITEGEIDALSYAEIAKGWEVVSVPNGVSSAVKAVKRSLEYVESFDEVVFMFDNDEVGYNAALECAEVLSPGKSKIAKLSLKDANEMLVNNKVAELKESVYTARQFSPDGIVLGSEITLGSLQEQTARGFDIPYTLLSQAIRGLRKRELVTLTAGSGIGKSTIARELGYHLATEHELNVGYVMLEESITKTAQALVAIDNNVPLADLAEDTKILNQEQWQKSYDKVVKPIALYDHWGSTEVDSLISKLRYMAVGLECDFIILDHVSMVVSGLDTDERKTLDLLMTKLRQLVENTGVGIIAISHLKRGDKQKSFNEGGSISLTDLRGSAALEQLSDIVIGLERDQQDEAYGNYATIRLLKNRPVGIVGRMGAAEYKAETGRLLEVTQQEDTETVSTEEIDNINDI